MSKFASPFGLYAILTDPIIGYPELAKICSDLGVAFVQLRMKDVSEDEVQETAFAVREAIDSPLTKFIINDDPFLALECGADGVHLGQDDMLYGEARKIVGDEAIIGLSTHNLAQAKAACAYSPDYIGTGPVYPTPTKKIADPTIGLLGMQDMHKAATVPAVAIGGITFENLHDVLNAGARNICMVRQITHSDEPERVIKKAQKIIGEYGV